MDSWKGLSGIQMDVKSVGVNVDLSEERVHSGHQILEVTLIRKKCKNHYSKMK